MGNWIPNDPMLVAQILKISSNYTPPPPEGIRKYYGPTMKVFEAAEKQGRAGELQKQLEDLFNSQNKRQAGTSIPATFLRVTVSV